MLPPLLPRVTSHWKIALFVYTIVTEAAGKTSHWKLKAGLGFVKTQVRNPVYEVFHRVGFCGNESSVQRQFKRVFDAAYLPVRRPQAQVHSSRCTDVWRVLIARDMVTTARGAMSGEPDDVARSCP